MHKYDLSNWLFLPLWFHLVTVSHIVQLKILFFKNPARSSTFYTGQCGWQVGGSVCVTTDDEDPLPLSAHLPALPLLLQLPHHRLLQPQPQLGDVVIRLWATGQLPSSLPPKSDTQQQQVILCELGCDNGLPEYQYRSTPLRPHWTRRRGATGPTAGSWWCC